MINWKVRVLNKNFWLSLIPAVILLAQAVLAVFGITVDFGETGTKLLAVVNAAFVVLAILGIVTDPTTEGVGDSARALSYNKPKPKGADDGSSTLDYAFTWTTLRDKAGKLAPSDQSKLIHELITMRNAKERALKEGKKDAGK